MILADTSIWIEIFRRGRFKAELENLIIDDQLCIHPFLIAELALGTLPERKKTLAYLDQLISKTTGVPCYVADDPLFCVVKGTGTVLENLEEYKKVVMSKK